VKEANVMAAISVRIGIGFIALMAIFGCSTSGSSQTQEQYKTQSAPPLPSPSPRWVVMVCRSSTATSEITMQAGPTNTDYNVFATWKASDGGGDKLYKLPESIQDRNTIYFRATSPENKQGELCVKFNNHPKKKISFDDGDEDAWIGASDDDAKCRC
jgi:hypothetical protein